MGRFLTIIFNIFFLTTTTLSEDFFSEHPVNKQRKSQDFQIWFIDRRGSHWIEDGPRTGRDRTSDGEHVLEIRTSGSGTGRGGIQDREHFVEIWKARWDLVDVGPEQEEGECLLQEQQIVGEEEEGDCFHWLD